MSMPKIVVDAMGGDHAPEVVVQGAVLAAKEYEAEIILVGDEAKVRPLLAKTKYPNHKISLLHASDAIGMDEPAAASVRRRKNSSIVIGLNIVKDLKADAFFSAGNTGAVVCASTLMLGLLEGIERPGIAIITPTLKGTSMILDVGANIIPKPVHLLQYGIMAAAYSQNILNKPNPSVGLLNVGEEETKGTEFVKETHELLSKSPVNFIGNIEGKDLFSGKCDIVICDGFVGNIALKVTESVAETMQAFLKKHLLKSFFGKIGVIFLRSSLLRFKKELDYTEYGGAPLLGVNGIVIIGHGRSNANAIKNAIRVAKEEVERNVNQKIIENLNPPAKI